MTYYKEDNIDSFSDKLITAPSEDNMLFKMTLLSLVDNIILIINEHNSIKDSAFIDDSINIVDSETYVQNKFIYKDYLYEKSSNGYKKII